MPKPKSKKAQSSISKIVDSDSEVDSNTEKATDSADATKILGKKLRRKPTTKNTKSNSTATRTSDRVIANAKLAKSDNNKLKKTAIVNHSNQNNSSKYDDIDDFLSDDPVVEVSSSVRVEKKEVARPKAAKKIPAAKLSDGEETREIQKTVVCEAPKKRGRLTKETSSENSSEKIIMETQKPQVEVNESSCENVEQTDENVIHSLQRDDTDVTDDRMPTKRRRLSFSPHTERNSDTAVRRRFDEISAKYENLKARHEGLIEIGLKEAERNFDTLKIQIAEKLITSLKADLAAKKAIAKEVPGLKKQIDSHKLEITTLQTKLHQLESLLAETQAENKIFSAKLAVNRTTAASVESFNSKVPGSAIKVNGGIRMVGTAEAAQTAQAPQLKEDLYSDLTGLLMRSVTRGTEEDYFDCIQTGHNGTLHFKLATGNEKSAESYDDIQCTYTPLLDPSRDKALIEVLPDYLADEITFPRPHSAKFYARVFKALTEKPAA